MQDCEAYFWEIGRGMRGSPVDSISPSVCIASNIELIPWTETEPCTAMTAWQEENEEKVR